MRRTFETEAEWRRFCDESMYCICGKLMTGLHMRICARVKKEDAKWGTLNGAMRVTESGSEV